MKYTATPRVSFGQWDGRWCHSFIWGHTEGDQENLNTSLGTYVIKLGDAAYGKQVAWENLFIFSIYSMPGIVLGEQL